MINTPMPTMINITAKSRFIRPLLGAGAFSGAVVFVAAVAVVAVVAVGCG